MRLAIWHGHVLQGFLGILEHTLAELRKVDDVAQADPTVTKAFVR